MLIALVCFSANSFMISHMFTTLANLEETVQLLGLRVLALEKKKLMYNGRLGEEDVLAISGLPSKPDFMTHDHWTSQDVQFAHKYLETVEAKAQQMPPGSWLSFIGHPNATSKHSSPLKHPVSRVNISKLIHPCMSVIPKKIVQVNCTNLPAIKDPNFEPKTKYVVVNLPRTGSSYLQEAMHSHPDVMVSSSAALYMF
jgi:hypothetical protein